MNTLKLIGLFVISVCFFKVTGQNSPLTSGEWVQLEIINDGIYKIDYAQLKSAGISGENIAVNSIHLYGNNGLLMPEYNYQPRKTGLQEVAIKMEDKNNNQIWDNGDYLLFYAEGTTKWNYNGFLKQYKHQNNWYENRAKFIIGYNTNLSIGLRIGNQNSSALNPEITIDQSTYLYVNDSDMVNPVKKGKRWLGLKLGNETLVRNFSINTPKLINDSALITTEAGCFIATTPGNLTVLANGIYKNEICTVTVADYYKYNVVPFDNLYVKTNNNNIDLKYTFNRSNGESSAWIDYFEVQGRIFSSYAGNFFKVMNPDLISANVSKVYVKGTGFMLWEIGNKFQPKNCQLLSENGGFYTITENNKSYTEFIAFEENKAIAPIFIGKLNNSNIIGDKPTQLIIITIPEYKAAAQKLADYRIANQKITAKVVLVGDIFKEFNSGGQDIVAIRDYLRHQYNSTSVAADKPKWVLLFGATSYDFKNRIANNANHIPIYESHNEIETSVCSDDFYGYLDSVVNPVENYNNYMRVSIGRLPIYSVEEANLMVEKLIRYDSKKNLGPWRKNISLVADDCDTGWEGMFTTDSEDIAKYLDKNNLDYDVQRIYADAYKQETTGNTEKYPEVSIAINRAIQEGSVIINYQGHGGEEGWAQEHFLSEQMVKSWKNLYNNPILFTATCEFSLYDNPQRRSAGVETLLNPEGGTIGLISTTRMVLVGGNTIVNSAFWKGYGFPSVNEHVKTLGELYTRMKNRDINIRDNEDNKFGLLGDPSMPLPFPEHAITVDSLNGSHFDYTKDTVKAFQTIKLTGFVRTVPGQIISDFNGKLWISISDKKFLTKTLNNDGQCGGIEFTANNSYIYKGQVSVINGKWTVSFTIPKDINYSLGFGKISLYAHNDITDASGSSKIFVGSSVNITNTDEEGPVIKPFINDFSFKWGGNCGSDATILAKIADLSGINSTGNGIGRDITITIDPGTTKEKLYVVNEYFLYDLNSYQRGVLKFNVLGLAPGKHMLKIKAWDVFNNSGVAYLEFNVVGTDEIVVKNHFPKPNPSSGKVNFVIESNMAGKAISADIAIFDLAGNKVYNNVYKIANANSVEDRIEISLNGLKPGMYVYKIILQGNEKQSTTFAGKLIRIN